MSEVTAMWALESGSGGWSLLIFWSISSSQTTTAGAQKSDIIAICFWNRWFQCHCRIVQLCERGAEHTFLCHFHLHTICAQCLQPNATLSSVSLCTVIPIFKQYPISPTPNGGVFTPVVVLGNFQKAVPVWVFGSGINTSEALGTTS